MTAHPPFRPLDSGVTRAARRLEWVLLATLAILAYQAVVDPGLSRILYGASALGLGLTLLLARARGKPLERPLQILGAVAGAGLLLGGIGLMGASVWLLTVGSYAILMGLVLIPLGLGVGAWGYTLLGVALSGKKASTEVDLDVARKSEAVRRFDALHRPPEAKPADPSHGDGDEIRRT